jgi:hypothetical protein
MPVGQIAIFRGLPKLLLEAARVSTYGFTRGQFYRGALRIG